MTGGQTLALILALLYLSECLLWLDIRSLVLWRWFGRWRSISGKDAFGSSQGGVVVLNPLPPLCESFRAESLPLWLSPQGVAASVSGSVAFAPFTDSTEFRAENKTVLAGEQYFPCATPHQALKVATILNSLAQSSPEARADAIRAFWGSQFDIPTVRERVKRVQTASHLLRLLCNIQYGVIFGIGLLFAIATELHIPIFALLLVMAAMNIALAILYFRAARKLYPEDREDRIIHLVKMLFCPPLSLRACDFLTLPATRDFDSLAVEMALREPEQVAAPFARRWRETKYPIAEVSDEAWEVLQWNQTELMGILERTGKDAGLDPEQWQGAVAPEPGSLSYCPRCLCQFTYAEGTCRDCAGVAVHPFRNENASAR